MQTALIQELQALTFAQVLASEGMPAELPLLTESPDCVHLRDDSNDVDADDEYVYESREVAEVLSLAEPTAVDTFIAMHLEPVPDYRWKDKVAASDDDAEDAE